jgi:hypothetical protein
MTDSDYGRFQAAQDKRRRKLERWQATHPRTPFTPYQGRRSGFIPTGRKAAETITHPEIFNE